MWMKFKAWSLLMSPDQGGDHREPSEDSATWQMYELDCTLLERLKSLGHTVMNHYIRSSKYKKNGVVASTL